MGFAKFASVKFCRAMKLPTNAPFPLNFFQIVVVFVVVRTPIAWGWRSFKVIFTSFPYSYNADVVNAKVQIQNSSSDMYLSVVLQVNKNLDDVHLKYGIALELEEGNYTALVNGSVNFCKFLKQNSIDPTLRIIYEDILKQGNFIKRCPISKGLYTLREYRIDEEILPSYVPEANFCAEMKLSSSDGQKLFDGKLYGKIDKSKGFNNLKMFSLG